MFLSVFVFVANCFFKQTYKHEHKDLNFKEHKEEFQMRNLPFMGSSRVKKNIFFGLIFTATARVAEPARGIFHLENISPTKLIWRMLQSRFRFDKILATKIF